VKRLALSLAAVIALAAALYLWLHESDEDQIRDALADLAAAAHVGEGDTSRLLRASHVQRAFANAFDAEVRASVPELGSTLPVQREALAEMATDWTMLYRTGDAQISDVVVKLDDVKSTARVSATASLRGLSQSGPVNDQRGINLLLRKADGHWRITSLTVWPPDESPP
jgi:hypothetical protein